MRKFLIGAALALTVTSSVAEAPPEVSWLVEAATFYRLHKLCPQAAHKEDVRVIGDLLLAASVNPYLKGKDATDDDLMRELRWPSDNHKALVARELALADQVTATMQLKHEMEGSLCQGFGMRAGTFVRRAHNSGAASLVKRIADLMVQHSCYRLGDCR